MVTNRLGAYQLMTRASERELLDARSLVLRQGRLPRLDTSTCSNHLGVDVLGVTADGRILIIHQVARNMLSRQLLASSGSGSVDWADLQAGET